MIKQILISLLLVVPSLVQAGEREHQAAFCDQLSGQMEVVLEDKTRVDCLTDKYAYEVDYAKKWAEGFGQAWHYSLMTDRKPGVVLIIEDPLKDLKYIARLANLVVDSKKNFRVWLIYKYKPFLFLR